MARALDDRESVLDTIKRLQLVGKQAANENEAAAAAAQAQRLLLKHNLTMTEVETHEEVDDDPLVEECEEIRGAGGKSIRNMPEWKRRLATAVAGSCLCSCWYSLGGYSPGCYFYFVGRKSNVEVARYLFQYLEKQMQRVYREAQKEMEYRGDFGGRAYWNGWLLGCVAGVSTRLNREMRSFEEQTPETRALVRQRGKEAVQYRDQCHPGLRSGTWRGASDYSGYNAGAKAGGQISIRRGIEGNGTGQRLVEGGC